MSSDSLRGLALETTSRRGEVALVEHGRVVSAEAFQTGLKHTAQLLPLVDRLCAARRWAPRAISEIYVSAGPGAFTGTRIGVTFAKTFAFAAGARVVAVPTPRVVVENAPPEATRALVVVDARRGKTWVQAFNRSPLGWEPAGESVLAALSEILAREQRPIWLIGEGIAYHSEQIDGNDKGIVICPDHQPRAQVVASIGWSMARRGAVTDPFLLVPIYVRRPEAEEKRLGLS